MRCCATAQTRQGHIHPHLLQVRADADARMSEKEIRGLDIAGGGAISLDECLLLALR